MDGQAKLFPFSFSRGRSGNQPKPKSSSSGSSEQIRKPSSSKESTSSPLKEEERSRSQSVRPVLFAGTTSGASEDGGFCVPCALFHRSRGQDGQLITKPMTNWN